MLRHLKPLTIGTFTVFLTALPLEAAQRIYFIYGPLNLSLGIDSLTQFAQEETVNKELAYYMGIAGVSDEQKAEFREALLKKADLDPVQLWRFFNTPTGEKILDRIGTLIAIQGGRNGKYALRGALVQAALDPKEGLTLLNFLRHLPTNIQLNLAEIFQVAEYIEILTSGTTVIVEEMARLSDEEAQQKTPVDYGVLPDIRQPGKYGVAPEQVWKLTDKSRNPERTFKVLLYRPQQWREGKTPVVVLSHGLASRPEDFSDRAQQLASYGYLVALPQHPGSDSQHLQDMLEGYTGEIYSVNEFIDRPLDVSYLLDELQRRNQTEFGGRLDLDRVGVLGHSFGGYTALALAGATLDFENLQRVCDRLLWEPNLSLLLQCRALELPRKTYNFRDERVKAVFAINPVDSAIFGAEGLGQVTIPVFLGGGSNDPAAPVAIEQLKAFVWLNTPDKYLALVVGQAHVNFTKLDANAKALFDSLPNLTLPDQSLIDQYDDALLVAFNEVYVVQNEDYRPYLRPAYGEYISGEPNLLYFVTASAEVPLSQLFNRLRPKEFPPIFPPGKGDEDELLIPN